MGLDELSRARVLARNRNQAARAQRHQLGQPLAAAVDEIGVAAEDLVELGQVSADGHADHLRIDVELLQGACDRDGVVEVRRSRHDIRVRRGDLAHERAKVGGALRIGLREDHLQAPLLRELHGSHAGRLREQRVLAQDRDSLQRPPGGDVDQPFEVDLGRRESP